MPEQIRLDKWLWAARFFKTRSLCAQEIGKGRILLNRQLPKASREVKPGDLVEIRRGDATVTVIVQAVSNVRGPAQAAQQLYTETPESIAARERAAELRRLAPEPARDLDAGRPTKRDRRAIERLRGSGQ
ncbi:MAG TPA: RNA-binding S4 domain-containing protein [Eoetvoesiella sp.]|jgi:ribosome-associated heat shock protein Hsp15|uniref:RNA-binding S4 domain-containing protein n=1 Tax=Eoetvoesiella sp. TaxID=1966355 RepID=UPI002CB17C60|nr:RNA-binding S4 domain-containing protein [Eoetvoesiella sp.]HWK62222.1 RNA-binding S4 domain-containing protein [Eoetvoesiella sp.]